MLKVPATTVECVTVMLVIASDQHKVPTDATDTQKLLIDDVKLHLECALKNAVLYIQSRNEMPLKGGEVV